MLVALANPASGHGLGRDRLRTTERLCAEAGRELEVIHTRGPRDVVRAATEAAERAPEAIVLIGGDGSVGELARAYLDLPSEARVPVILVPAGRGNSMYKALLFDAPWKEYLRRALQGFYVRAADAGQVVETGDVWTLGFSLGYFHDAVESTRYFRGLRGRTLYLAAGAFAAMRLRPFAVEVHVDGRPVYAGRSVLVGCAGGPFRGGRLLLYPTSDLTDGLLDCVVVEAVHPRRFAEVIRAAGRGEHVGMPDVHEFKGTEVRVSSTDPMRCEIDGTVFPYADGTVTVRVVPGLLPVAFPSWDWDDLPTAPGPQSAVRSPSAPEPG